MTDDEKLAAQSATLTKAAPVLALIEHAFHQFDGNAAKLEFTAVIKLKAAELNRSLTAGNAK